jgi:MFS family permease
MVVIGIVGFAGFSALCGATPKGSYAEAWLITFRALQGVAGAIMIPAALAIVVAAFPIQERGRALAIFFGVSGGLTAVGPIAGGYLTQWTWRAIFWINVPVAILALVLTLLATIPPSRKHEPIDWPGAALTIVGMGLSVLGFEQASSWGWDNPATWLCIVGGLAVLAVFVRVEARTEYPLIRVQVFRDRAFVVDNAVLFLSMIAFVPVFFFASVYSQVSLGYDASNAGLYLLVFFAGFAPAAQVGGRMLDAGGARRPVVLGCALATVGFALWAWKITDLSLGAQWPYIVIAGAGLGLLLGPASTDAVNRAIGASYGEVTGITQTVRNYASALGIAVLGTALSTVLAHRLTDSFRALGLPPSVADAATDSSTGRGSGDLPASVPANLRGAIEDAVSRDFAVATRAVLIGMAIALGAAFAVALTHPGGRPGSGPTDVAADTTQPAQPTEPAA